MCQVALGAAVLIYVMVSSRIIRPVSSYILKTHPRGLLCGHPPAGQYPTVRTARHSLAPGPAMDPQAASGSPAPSRCVSAALLGHLRESLSGIYTEAALLRPLGRGTGSGPTYGAGPADGQVFGVTPRKLGLSFPSHRIEASTGYHPVFSFLQAMVVK